MIKVKKIKISIIVPVFNVQKYLDRCLMSICNQTIDNKEIIIINDASTDESLDIVMKYHKAYENIVVINQKINGGQGKARNLAIDIAKGDFIGFVDGDDFIESDMFEKMYNEAVKEKLDITICNFNLYFEKNHKTITNIILNHHETISKNEAIKRFLVEKTIEGFSCNKIFKKEIFKNIRFIEGMFYEDIPTVFRLIINSNKIGFINNYLYNYVQRSNSVTNSIKSKNLYEFILALDEVSKILDLNDLYNTFNNEIKLYNFKIVYEYNKFLICKKYKGNDIYVEKINSVYKAYRKKINIKYVLFNKNINLKEKNKILLFKFKMPTPYYFKVRIINSLMLIFRRYKKVD